MRVLKKKTIAIATTGLSAILALTGCSGGGQSGSAGSNTESAETGAAPERGVFEFQTPRYGSDSGELLIRLPEALLETATDRELLVMEVLATPRELGGAKYCAVDLELTFANDGQEILALPSEDPAYFPGQPRWDMVRDGSPVSELDDTAPERGVYYTEDLSVFTLVEGCAASPAEDGDEKFYFRALQPDGTVFDFARVELSVMKSGTITVTEAVVNDYQLDADGNWIAK